MDKKEIWRLAIESGLCDADLSTDTQLVTDYGDSTEAVERFAAMVEEATLKAKENDPKT